MKHLFTATSLTTILGLIFRLAWIVSIFLVIFFSLKPSLDLPSEFWNSDKLYHTGMYCWLAILPFLGFSSKRKSSLAAGSMILLGLSLEFAQSSLPTRDFSILDSLANTLGVFIGGWLGVRIQFVFQKIMTTVVSR
jgi:VanZ family protein